MNAGCQRQASDTVTPAELTTGGSVLSTVARCTVPRTVSLFAIAFCLETPQHTALCRVRVSVSVTLTVIWVICVAKRLHPQRHNSQAFTVPKKAQYKERPTAHTRKDTAYTPHTHAYGQRVRPEIQYILSTLWPSDVQAPGSSLLSSYPLARSAALSAPRTAAPARRRHTCGRKHIAGVGWLSPKDSRVPLECRRRSGGDTPYHRAPHHRTP